MERRADVALVLAAAACISLHSSVCSARPMEPSSFFDDFHFTIGGLASLGGWGWRCFGKCPSNGYSVAQTRQPAGGFHLAAMVAVNEHFHLGAHTSFYAGGLEERYPDEEHSIQGSFLSFGATVTIGGAVGARTWLGGALDIGRSWVTHSVTIDPHHGFDDEEVDEDFDGLLLFPRFSFYYLFSRGPPKVSVFVTTGVLVYPAYVMGRPDSCSGTYYTMVSSVTFALVAGVATGI